MGKEVCIQASVYTPFLVALGHTGWETMLTMEFLLSGSFGILEDTRTCLDEPAGNSGSPKFQKSRTKWWDLPDSSFSWTCRTMVTDIQPWEGLQSRQTVFTHFKKRHTHAR